MQQSVTVAIDNVDVVHFAGRVYGSGEDDFQEALEAIPLSMLEHLVIRDERSRETGKMWEFSHPFDFDSPFEVIELYPPKERYPLDHQRQDAMRAEEKVFLDPDFEETTGLFEDEETSWVPAPRPEKEEVEEEEPEDDTTGNIEVVEVHEIDYSLYDDEEEEEEEEPEEEYIPPENAEKISWEPAPMKKAMSSGNQKEDKPMFRGYVSHEAIQKLPKGISEAQAYLPGERREHITLADKKAQLTVNRVHSKTPYYVLAALALFAMIFYSASQGWLSPAREYQTICTDTRTDLAANPGSCENNESDDYQIAYVPSEEASGIDTLDQIPESAVFEEPSGKVRIDGE